MKVAIYEYLLNKLSIYRVDYIGLYIEDIPMPPVILSLNMVLIMLYQSHSNI